MAKKARVQTQHKLCDLYNDL